MESNLSFLNEKGSFYLKDADKYKALYFPIASEQGLKSVVTPDLGGDSKIDQNTFLLEPESVENLHNNRAGRNFWCGLEDGSIWSAVGRSAEAEAQKLLPDAETSDVCAGFMWHIVTRKSKKHSLSAKTLSFVPYNKNFEIMQVDITNNGDKPVAINPVAAIPLYGRSADNIRDHRHVTSLLHRISTTEDGVFVKPTLSFDERGHRKNEITYFVTGISEYENLKEVKPESFFPTVEEFIGEEGTYTNPEAVAKAWQGFPAGTKREGLEAMGGLKFPKVTIEPKKTASYTIFMGLSEEELDMADIIDSFSKREKVYAAVKETEKYWQEKVNLWFHTGNKEFDNYMRWVSFQPFLRRVYGCSFLPHHDYGKGGRGWRDFWQDCLALLIMDPSDVRQMILDNFGGVRIDGTNATIIGSKQGEFIADRNNITRVWMDHGMWPFLTTSLYIEQTGDLAILNESQTYFKDRQTERGTATDERWNPDQGNKQLTEVKDVYKGTVLEHLLLQHICALYETGEHGKILLRGADWNDAIDMATKRGESVAFSCAYAGNLKKLAMYIRKLVKLNGNKEIQLFEELVEFLQMLNSTDQNTFTHFEKRIRHEISGKKLLVDGEWLAQLLEEKAENMMNLIRKDEWVTDGKGNGWFNSYYDDNGRMVEGLVNDQVRMMLTGQVFSIMSGTASQEQVAAICKSADEYLYKKEVGGYRLNTDFQEEKYDMGRMFGFAYGQKENGAVFSHMTVMYANALYTRGFVREGYKALQTLADTALDFNTSKIYPGIPEYFDANGRGLYHYLTGAASWYALTMVTEVFGVKGADGNLKMEPKLVKEQFDQEGKASIEIDFAGKRFEVIYRNPNKKDFGEYVVKNITLNDEKIGDVESNYAIIQKGYLETLTIGTHTIVVDLD